jgi:hypothetical protein
MTRTQISLTEEQHRFLVSLSRQTGESISSLIRKAVDELRNKQSTPRQKALKLLESSRRYALISSRPRSRRRFIRCC